MAEGKSYYLSHLPVVQMLLFTVQHKQPFSYSFSLLPLNHACVANVFSIILKVKL